MREALAAWCIAFAEETEPPLLGLLESKAFARLDADLGNLRVAEAWTIEQGDAEQALTIAGGLGWSWWLSGHAEEGHRLIESALACPGAAKPGTRALAAMWASYVGANAGTGMARALRWGEEAIGLWRQSGDPTGLKETLVLHANVLAALGRRADAAAAFAEARRLNGPGHDEWHRAVALYAEGRLAAMEDDLEVAERLQLESVTWFEAAGAAWATATVNADIAALAEGRGDLVSAIERTESALDAARRLAMRGEEAFLLGRLGNLWLSAGDHARAEAYHEEALTLSDELGFRPGAAMALNGRALARRLTGRLDEAASCAQRARALYSQSESAAGEALSLATLGFVAELRGDLDEALELHQHGLAVARRTGGLGAVALALEGLAGVAAASGDGERAARLLGHAGHLRHQYGGAWAGPASDAERIADAAMAIVGGDAFDAALRQGGTSDLEGVLA